MRVALIGPRGAGKTTIGAPLAEALGVPFFDADDVLEQKSGRTIAANASAISKRVLNLIMRIGSRGPGSGSDPSFLLFVMSTPKVKSG